MKTTLWFTFFALAASFHVPAWAQNFASSALAPGRAPGSSDSSAYVVVERTPHSRTWANITAALTNGQSLVWQTNTYQEVASGLCFANPETGQLEDSSPDFAIDQDGYAVAARTQHPARVTLITFFIRQRTSST